MQFSVIALAIASSLANCVIAASPASSSWSDWSGWKGSSRCYTVMASTSGPCDTTTKTTTTSPLCTSTLTVNATITTTPVVSTLTSTEQTTVVVTGATISDTSTATTTSTVTSTVTTTDISTETSTSVFSTSTVTTVAAPATFTPIQKSLPGVTYDPAVGAGNLGGSPAGKRSIVDKRAPGKCRPLAPAVSATCGLLDFQYPKQVICHTTEPAPSSTKCAVATTTLTSTVTASTPSTTVTTTSTITSTTIPSTLVVTTATVMTTVIATTGTVSTTTTTTTSTSYTSTSTVYAACATNNFGTTYKGKYFSNASGSWTNVASTSANSAYECCVAAITRPTGYSVLWAYYTNGSKTCLLAYNANTCPNTASSTGALSSTSTFVFGNGLCAQMSTAQ